MTPQQHQFRFPRLRAALALTGVFAMFNATAQGAPSCFSEEESFGDFRMQSVLYYPTREGINAQYKTTLYRSMPKTTDSYFVVNDASGQREAMAVTRMRFQIEYFYSREPGKSAAEVNELSLIYPDNEHSGFSSQLDSVMLHVGDTEVSPRPQNDYWMTGFSRGNFTEQDAFAVFDHWAHGNVVIVEFRGEQGDQQVTIGDVLLAPDGIDQFHTVLESQHHSLAKKAHEGECSPRRDVLDDCFLTTATVHCIGLEDDCWELQTLREFRDNFLLQNNQGRAIVADYYDIAPAIVEAVNRRADSEWQWLKTYWTGILPTALLVKAGMHGSAQRLYQRVVHDLQAKIG